MTSQTPSETRESQPLNQPTGIDSTSIQEARRRRKGIALMCGALICFALLDAIGKWLGKANVPVWEVVWFRYIGATLLVSLAINPFTTPHVLASNKLWLQILRSLLLFGSTLFNFLALRYLQLAETMAVSFSMPLLVALLAGPILGEWVGPRRLIAIAVGFIGVLVVTRPGTGAMHPAIGYAVACTCCYALYSISTRVLAAHDSSRTTTVYSALSGVVLLTPFLPFFWVWPESPLVWLMLALIGFFGGFGHWLLVLAHARTPAPILAPFVYTQIIWMTGLGYLVFADIPGPFTLGGACIVIASGLYLWYRERVVKADDAQPSAP
jgi:drug/metabolite transporter (DMT)-like permease